MFVVKEKCNSMRRMHTHTHTHTQKRHALRSKYHKRAHVTPGLSHHTSTLTHKSQTSMLWWTMNIRYSRSFCLCQGIWGCCDWFMIK